tara:strand:+ start:385 stop:1017 length:633 start_codon:yes stop_codon:yes gene_type:complete
MSQKKIFLIDEGDSYYKRNLLMHDNKNHNFICQKILELSKNKKKINILEIGCGRGDLLKKFYNLEKSFKLFGIDPSKQAIKSNKNKHIKLKRGTADSLPFNDKNFDFVIFGFCLYLVDKDLLFKVVSEADRVLKFSGNILIYDFYSKNSSVSKYSHNKSVKTHKMNFSKLFINHPFYKIIYKKFGDHTDINKKPKVPRNLISLFILKKNV